MQQNYYVPGGQWAYQGEMYNPTYQQIPQGALQPAYTYKLTPLNPAYNPMEDCEKLRKAMKGLGTDEDAMIAVLAKSTYLERQAMKTYYEQVNRKDLIAEIKSEISGKFLEVVMAMFKSPDQYDCETLYNAIKGAGTDDKALIEILCTRSNAQINLIKQTFNRMYAQDLIKWVKGDTTGTFEKILCGLLAGTRSENLQPNEAQCKIDAQNLYESGEKRLGTDEEEFTKIFCYRSNAELRCIFYFYNQIAGHPLSKAIDSEFSGNAKKALLAIFECISNPSEFFAGLLYYSMKGAGTKDRLLMRTLVTRHEIDLPQIKEMYRSKYGEELVSAVKGDTSGDYRNLLMAMVNSK